MEAEKNQNIMEKLNEFYSRRDVQISLDIIRIATLIGVIMIGYYMYQNVEEVKLLNSDACRLCENKTGAKCYIEYGPTGEALPNYDLNLSVIEEAFSRNNES